MEAQPGPRLAGTRGDLAGDPIAAREAGQEGRDLAEAIGDRFDSRVCRWCLGMAQLFQGDLAGAATQFDAVAAEAGAAHDGFYEAYGLASLGIVLVWQGDAGAARAAADAAIEAAAELGGLATGSAYWALAAALLSEGDTAAALSATESAWQHLTIVPAMAAVGRAFNAQAALAGGDLVAARRWADEAVTSTTGYYLSAALLTRASVAIAQGEPEQAERDAYDALACAAEVEAYRPIPDILECLAGLAGQAGSHREAARFFGAAHGIRQRMGAVRVRGAGYKALMAGGS